LACVAWRLTNQFVARAAIDVASKPREPRLAAEVSPAEIAEKTGLAWPHTSHCLGNGEIMVSFMGDAATGEARGGFALFDQDLAFKGSWSKEATPFGYDFWRVAPSRR